MLKYFQQISKGYFLWWYQWILQKYLELKKGRKFCCFQFEWRCFSLSLTCSLSLSLPLSPLSRMLKNYRSSKFSRVLFLHFSVKSSQRVEKVITNHRGSHHTRHRKSLQMLFMENWNFWHQASEIFFVRHATIFFFLLCSMKSTETEGQKKKEKNCFACL